MLSFNMSDRKPSIESAFRSTLLHIVADAIAITTLLLGFYFFHEIVNRLVSSDWLVAHTSQIEKVMMMACTTLFSLKVVAEISLEAYRTIGKGLSSAWSQTKRFKWVATSEAFSYLVGIFGFAVVYLLIHQAAGVDNVTAKAMIYVAAFVLSCEIAYMAAATVKDRVFGTAETGAAMPQ